MCSILCNIDVTEVKHDSHESMMKYDSRSYPHKRKTIEIIKS